jgi:hypothetical protein
MRAGIARQKAELLQFGTQLRVELYKGAGYAEPAGARLAGDSAAVGEDQKIELVRRFGRQKRLADVRTGGLAHKIIFKRPLIDRDLSLSGPQDHTRGGGFPASGSQMLNQLRWH